MDYDVIPSFNNAAAKLEEGLAPKLIDTSALHYLDGALKKSHQIRVTYHQIIWNWGLLFLFVAAFGAFLYYRWTNKPTAAEANYKLIKDQEYVLSKIRFFQEQNQKIKQLDGSELTGLPVIHPNEDNPHIFR
jgi:hypothetical protein